MAKNTQWSNIHKSCKRLTSLVFVYFFNNFCITMYDITTNTTKPNSLTEFCTFERVSLTESTHEQIHTKITRK
jgi:hypothetical protein